MGETVSIQDLMNLLPEFFLPNQAEGVRAMIGFELSGNKGGVWGVCIEMQTCRVIREMPNQPDVKLIADAQVLLDIFTGKLDAMRAYLTGNIKIEGNMGMALQLPRLFKVDQQRLAAMGGKLG
ncbi:MAG: SCP2 sterol-binding domain-containing protein [Bellilinea sp.]|jgi:putative sterol carrier protein